MILLVLFGARQKRRKGLALTERVSRNTVGPTYLTYTLYAVVSMTGFGLEIIYFIFTVKYV